MTSWVVGPNEEDFCDGQIEIQAPSISRVGFGLKSKRGRNRGVAFGLTWSSGSASRSTLGRGDACRLRRFGRSREPLGCRRASRVPALQGVHASQFRAVVGLAARAVFHGVSGRALPEAVDDLERDGKVEDMPLTAAHESLLGFYKYDEAHAFDLWYSNQGAGPLLVCISKPSAATRRSGWRSINMA